MDIFRSIENLFRTLIVLPVFGLLRCASICFFDFVAFCSCHAHR